MATISRSARTDGEITRARILKTAGELFAIHGFADMQNKSIAAHAQVDMASINYHFGSRKGLYQAVLVEAHHSLLNSKELLALAESNISAEKKLHWIFRVVVANAKHKESWYIRVLSREFLSPSQHLQTVVGRDLAPKLLTIKSILGEVVGVDAHNPVLDRCLLSVMAPCIVMLVSGSINAGPISQVMKTPEEQLVEHMMTFAMAGLHATREMLKQQKQTEDP